ncbi:MAG: hypothetical protein WKF36_10520 [Candidatus Nitrosocosmicus sp.]
MNYILPDIDSDEFNIKSESERIIIYRKLFAEMRLNRLYYHRFLLKLFLGISNQEDVRSLLLSNSSFLDIIPVWMDRLKENGNYEEFKRACTEEMDAIEKIIQTYKSRMNV